MPPPFERSVFINCPFDADFAPILQAIAFCVTDMGFYPRLAPENGDNAAGRLDRIIDLVRGSKYAIHDLSRCRSVEANQYARLNMPFELGIDYGARCFGDGTMPGKSILILEESKFDYQKSLSDIAGWDIHSHKGDFIRAGRHVCTWLVEHAGAQKIGAALIQQHYATFQEWYWERELAAGSSEEDIREYPAIQMVRAMQEWLNLNRPSG